MEKEKVIPDIKAKEEEKPPLDFIKRLESIEKLSKDTIEKNNELTEKNLELTKQNEDLLNRIGKLNAVSTATKDTTTKPKGKPGRKTTV